MNLAPVVRALRFHGSDAQRLRDLPDSRWNKLLEATDRAHLTLPLGIRCREVLPEQVRQRIDRNLADNAIALKRTWSTYHDLTAEFDRRGVEFVVLKGMAQWPFYSDAPEHRPRYDIDVLCQGEDLTAAREAAAAIGYEPLDPDAPVDHLPVMVLRNGWRWRGNYYDPETPPNLDIHFRLWDSDTEGFDIEGVGEFWFRRAVRHTVAGPVPALSLADGLAYSALHFLRHLFRGDPRPYHGYEIAHFLERTAVDDAFWQEWRDTHPAKLRRIEAIAFRFAQEWFGCRLSDEAANEISVLPEGIQNWFERFSFSPFASPNKDDLFLQLQLIPERSKKIQVTVRRVLPMRVPKFLTAHVSPSPSLAERFSRAVEGTRFLARRAATHAGSLLPLAVSGSRWWWTGKRISPGYLAFLAAANLFNIGMSGFFLLYNLHLLRLGFREDMLGLVASAGGAGSIAGTIPAGFFARRFGLRSTLVAAFLVASAIGVIRAVAVTPPMLIGSAFAWGFAAAVYAVCLAPIVSATTSERSRPFAFSLVCSSGIGAGVAGTIIGGRLPALLNASESRGLENALLVACAFAGLAGLIALWLNIPAHAEPPRGIRAGIPSRFIIRFLAIGAMWWLATGAFNPFFNAYLATELKMSTARIGAWVAWSQMAQVLAILAAPAILKRLGLVNGIGAMQIATAGAMLVIATRSSPFAVPVLICAYMAFQYMSEPGLFSLLMSGVAPGQTSTASSLNMFVMFSANAVAAAVAGISVRQFGYAPVLGVAAIGAALAGLAFPLFLRVPGRHARELQEPAPNSAPPETAQPTHAAR